MIELEGRWLGPGQPCFIAAEVGINHNGDMGLAHRCIDAAADAGADAVKFQNYRTEDFLSDRSLTYRYISEGREVVEPQYDMFKRCELTFAALQRLKTHSDHRGILLLSTPTSEEGVQDLLRLGVPALKNGSDYLVHLPLIRAMGRTGLPTVVSTGMANLAEIDDAVRAFRETGNDRLVLLHCTSAYPTEPDDVHLRKMPALAAAFGCLVGFSDHTRGVASATAAVALGAVWIEKHFTLDRGLPGPDHHFSSDPGELRSLVEGVRTVERALGESRVGPTEAEARGRREFRLSCVAARPLSAGHTLEDADLAFRRPGSGVPPAQAALFCGRVLRRDVPAGRALAFDDLA